MLTIGQLDEWLSQWFANKQEQQQPQPKRRMLSSFSQLAIELNCSLSKVYKMNRAGIFGDAIARCGNVVAIDLDRVYECMAENSRPRACSRTWK
jgi:hypothetical protein